MYRLMCKSKIQRLRVTKTALNYEGSIGLDKKLIEAANIFPSEMVLVLNVNSGARFETYVIEEKGDSGSVVLYGPAARLGQVGDKLIVLSKALAEAKEAQALRQKVVLVDENNRLIAKK